MDYTPTPEDIKFAKRINDEVIWTQTLNPFAIRQAFEKLFGYQAITATQAKIGVFNYFQYQYKPDVVKENILATDNQVDRTETADINQPSVVIENPSHVEDAKIYYNEDGTIRGATVKIGEDIHVIGAPSTDCQEDLRFYQNMDDEDKNKQLKIDSAEADLRKQHLLERIQELEAEYQQTTDSGRKRSISMKITNMKKKIK